MQIKTDRVYMCDGKINMPYYFRSSASKAADKRASKVLTNKTHNEFSDVFQAYAVLWEPSPSK